MRLVFDRGTIVLLDAARTERLPDCAGLLWDPRIGAHRAPAFRYREVASALATHGVRFSDDVPAVPERPGAWSAVDLRPYQHEALIAWARADQRGVIVLPTGSGKTRVALAAMAKLNRAALCLVPTRVLLDQWHGAIQALYPHRVGRFGDGHRELAPVTVSTYESAYRHMAEIGNRFGLLIVDEAHHFGSGLRDEALEMCTAPSRLGLTATPVREGDAIERIGELVGPVVHELAIGDLTGTFLAEFDLITIKVGLDPEERQRYEHAIQRYRTAFRDFRQRIPGATWRDFAGAAARTAEGRAAMHAWRVARRLVATCGSKLETVGQLLARHRGARILVFVAENEAAYAIAREHLVMPLTCDIGRRERDDVLDRFRRGALLVLVSARVLNEGLDVPDADVAIVVGGTQGEREHVQRIGRLLRPSPGKRAIVYELVTSNTIEVGQSNRRRQGLAARSATQLSRPR